MKIFTNMTEAFSVVRLGCELSDEMALENEDDAVKADAITIQYK